MNRRTLTALIPLLAILAGCMGPRPRIPATAKVDVPRGWRTDPGPAKDPLPDWWESLDDPVLSALVRRVVASNTDVLTAAARVQEADGRVRLVRSAEMPMVNLNALDVPRETTYSTATGKKVIVRGYKAELAVSYDADLFGKLRDQTSAARAMLLGTRASADAVRIATIASTIEDYVMLRSLDASQAVIEATLRSRQRELAMVTHRVREGDATQTAVHQASAEVHSVEQQLAQTHLQISRMEDAISVLLGEQPQGIPRGTALVELPLLDPPSTVPARLLRRRPDIYVAEQALVAADHSLDSARAAFMPDLQIAATADRLDANLLPNPLWVYSFMGTVLAPIFEGGRLRAGQDIAAAQRDQAAFAYRAAALGAFEEVENALAGVQQLAIKERAVAAEESDEKAALTSAERRFAEGYSSYEEVLDAERGLFLAQTNLVQVRADRLTAMIELYQAMGGGWTEPDAIAAKGDVRPLPATGGTQK